MRILYNSKLERFKVPFGTLKPAQRCTLHLHIPSSVKATQVEIVLTAEDRAEIARFPMQLEHTDGIYDICTGSFQLDECGLSALEIARRVRERFDSVTGAWG